MTFMESEYASWMDRFHLEFPDAVQPDQDTAEGRILQARGEEHERTFLCELMMRGRDFFGRSWGMASFQRSLASIQTETE